MPGAQSGGKSRTAPTRTLRRPAQDIQEVSSPAERSPGDDVPAEAADRGGSTSATDQDPAADLDPPLRQATSRFRLAARGMRLLRRFSTPRLGRDKARGRGRTSASSASLRAGLQTEQPEQPTTEQQTGHQETQSRAASLDRARGRELSARSVDSSMPGSLYHSRTASQRASQTRLSSLLAGELQDPDDQQLGDRRVTR